MKKKTCIIQKIIIIIIILPILFKYVIINTSVFYRKYILLPFTVHLNIQEVVLLKGETADLYVNGINKRVKFYSTNFRAAGVNFTGRVFAYRPGKAFIIAKVDNKKLKCRVWVIEMNKKNLDLSVGERCKLKVKGPALMPEWKSSDSKTASVSMFGKVTARRKGTAIITAKWRGKQVKCIVNVTAD